MGSILSDRQKDELHRSMLDYLSSSGYASAYAAFRAELPSDQQDFQPDPKAKWAGLLEKKWTSVIRLQKKIMELEKENAGLKEELATAGPSSARKGKDQDWVPGRSGGPHHVLSGHRSPITAVAFHPLFSNLVSASEDASLKVWDYESGEFEVTLKGHTKAVLDVDYDSKGLFIVSCSSDLTLKLWDTSKSHQCVKTLYDHDHSVSSCRFVGPGDAHVVSASRDMTIKIWEVATSHCVRTLRGHAEWVRGVWPTPDGRTLVSASNDQTARIWDFATGESKVELRGHDHVVEVATFAPVSAHAALKELAGIAPARAGTKAGLPGHAFVATGSRDKTIRLWDGTTGQCFKTLIGHDNWVRALVFHPSGKYLLSASDDKTLRIWDLRTGRLTRTVEAHEHFVTCMAWGRASAGGGVPTADRDGEQAGGVDAAQGAGKPVMVLATGSVDTLVKVWSA